MCEFCSVSPFSAKSEQYDVVNECATKKEQYICLHNDSQETEYTKYNLNVKVQSGRKKISEGQDACMPNLHMKFQVYLVIFYIFGSYTFQWDRSAELCEYPQNFVSDLYWIHRILWVMAD